MTTTDAPPSEQLEHLRKHFGGYGIPPENIFERRIADDHVEALKQQLRNQTKGQCYFFTKQLADKQTHVIAFVNIVGIAEAFEKGMEEFAKQQSSEAWQSGVSLHPQAEGSAPAEADF